MYAISAGGVSHSVAKACSQGLIPDCGCGDLPRSAVTRQQFIWSGCSDNVKYANAFGRKFFDAAEKAQNDTR